MTHARLQALAGAWLPPLLYTALIWWLSSQALHLEIIRQVPLGDRGVHFMEYAAMGLLIARAVHLTWSSPGFPSALFAVLLGTCLGLLDEFHQLFVPGRSAEGLDLLADGAGIIVAVGSYALWTTLRAELSLSS